VKRIPAQRTRTYTHDNTLIVRVATGSEREQSCSFSASTVYVRIVYAKPPASLRAVIVRYVIVRSSRRWCHVDVVSRPLGLAAGFVQQIQQHDARCVAQGKGWKQGCRVRPMCLGHALCLEQCSRDSCWAYTEFPVEMAVTRSPCGYLSAAIECLRAVCAGAAPPGCHSQANARWACL
jgi:hypothetical protein